MKKYNVFKVLGIVILLSILLSYFIPQTTISYGAVTSGNLNPVGIVDTFSNFITSMNVFISPFLYILVLAVFYGILKKSGKYDETVNNISSSFNANKGLFIIVSVLFLGIITTVIGDILPMLIFVPLLISVALKLGYKKTTAVATTIGSILIGSAGSLFTNITNQILYTTVQTNILYKIILSLAGLISLIIFILIFNKPADKTNISKIKSKKQLPILISFAVILFFIILGMTPWATYFGFKGFEELFKTVTDYKLLKVSVFNAFIGTTVTAWGTWQIFDLFVLIAVVSLILCIIYKINFNEILEVGAASIKRAIPYAFIVIIANVVLVNAYSSGWFVTIIKSLAGSKFNLFSGILASITSAIVYPDYAYGVQFSLTTVMYTLTKTKDYYEILALVYQSIYSIMLLISPTSILLLLGLYHLNIRYLDWIKYIWKYFLILLIGNVIILFIAWKGFNVSVIFSLVILFALVVALIVLKIKKVSSEMPTKAKENFNQINGKKVNKLTYCLLCFFFGGIGIHKFYVGKTTQGILCLLFSWTGIPGLIALIDFIIAICQKADKNGNIIIEVITVQSENNIGTSTESNKKEVKKTTPKKTTPKKTTTKKSTTKKTSTKKVNKK